MPPSRLFVRVPAPSVWHGTDTEQGAKSANFIVSLLQNPTKWQASINYAVFFGGGTVFDQPYRDRNFVGLTLARNF